MKSVVLFVVFLLFIRYGEWIVSTEAAPAPIAKQISVPGDFGSISDAIVNGVPPGNTEWILIKVAPGIYNEAVFIPQDKSYVIIQGSGRENTTIAWSTGNLGISAATFHVKGSNFMAKDITFKNTNSLQPLAPGVAARIEGDKCSFYNCGFLGAQDTLADYNGHHFFNSCYIEGIVDFIFGDGTSIYQSCTINVTEYGYITAQGRESADATSGYVFKWANVFGKGPTYLGRAWKAYARVLFYESTFADMIDPRGWDAWGNPENQISYSEVGCGGPGANQTGRVSWMKNLSQGDLDGLISMSFIDQDGWLENQPTI